MLDCRLMFQWEHVVDFYQLYGFIQNYVSTKYLLQLLVVLGAVNFFCYIILVLNLEACTSLAGYMYYYNVKY